MDNNEVTYIPYGQDEISQQELMTNLANGIPEYLSGKRWAQKPKNQKAWMAAYQDIIGKGLAGASNSSGVWKVNTNSTIDLDSMSDKDREIYQDAAYYIQQQMARMTPRKKKEEEKKKDQKTFNFSESFKQQLLNNYYGGDEKLFLDPEEGWNSLDAMDEKAGVRGTTERKKRVLSELQKYLENFKDDDYTFEGTSFTDASDARTKIQAAIDALNSPDTTDDAPAFNALGIQFRGLFSNGANEVSKYTLNGQPLTWKEYADYLKSEDQKKVKAEQDKKKTAIAQQQAKYYTNYRFFGQGLNGKPLSPEHSNVNYLNQLAQKDNWSGDEMSELVGVFKLAEKNGQLQNLSKEELEGFGHSRWNGRRQNIKKIEGLNGLYWDSVGKRIIKPYKGNAPQPIENGLQSMLDSKNPQKQQEAYLNSKIPGMTNAEWKELMAIGFDIGSIIDPEPFTAAGMGATAAGLRHAAKNETPGHKWGFWEGVGQGIDYLTGVIGAIPVGGDLVLAGKTLIKGSEMLPKVSKALRLLGRTGAWKDIYDSLDNGGKQTATKILNGEELTVQDWRNIGQLIRGIAGHHALNVSNRATKAVAEKSGYSTEASSSIVQKMGKVGEIGRSTGFFGSKVKNNKTTPTLKVQKEENGKVTKDEIEITETEKTQLEEAFHKSKPSERTTKAKEVLKDKMKEGYTVVVREGRFNKLRNSNPYTRKTSDSFGSKTSDAERGTDEFNNWLNNRGLFSRIKYGWNPRLRDIRQSLNIHQKIDAPVEQKEQQTSTEQPKIETQEIPRKEILKAYRGLFKNQFSENPIQSGSSNINGNSIQVVKQQDGSFNLLFKGDVVDNFNNQQHLQQAIRDLLQNNRKITTNNITSKIDTKKMGEILKEFKAKGWLKQGGIIDKQKIQLYKKKL